jgi:meiotically up-regulated gene 157 (Mug157) protein
MCSQTLRHTLETTTIVLPQDETFIHTGDLDDLWLRDSAAQIHTLLVPFFGNEHDNTNSLVATDPKLDRIVAGLIKRTAMYIRHDPYANAFRIDATYVFSEFQKSLGRHDLISTWNYELDSACYYIRMLYYYWKATTITITSPDTDSDNSGVLRLESVQQAVELMIDLWIAEQTHELDNYPKGPLFDCQNCNKPYRYSGLKRNGKGSATNATSGLTWTGFRPSDDACTYHFLVPANMFAVTVLEYVVEMAPALQWKNHNALTKKAQTLADQIQQGIVDHAIVEHPTHGTIYAYEVDGLGQYSVMDDANVPSLLSIPYLGYKHYDPAIYANTRKFILSHDNPTFESGTNVLTGPIEGYGSVHMEARIKKNIWPMSLAIQGLTSDSVEEKMRLVEQLTKASAGTGWMHESFDANNPSRFTRSWFCWADSLFAELVMSLTTDCPKAPSSHKYRVFEWRDPNLVKGGAYAEDD